MKTLVQKKGRNMFRSGFDPKWPKNSDEHLFRFKPTYACLFLKPTYIGSNMRMQAESMRTHV